MKTALFVSLFTMKAVYHFRIKLHLILQMIIANLDKITLAI